LATVVMQRSVLCGFMMKIKRSVGEKKMVRKEKTQYSNVN